MYRIQRAAAATLVAAGLSTAAFADGQGGAWTLDGDASSVAYGSIKKDKIGEVNTFTGLSGTVSADGKVEIAIDLSSVETNIDIRNERMIAHVFKGAGTATLSAQIDMAEVAGLAVGQSSVVDVEGSLMLVGTKVDIETEMFVLRVTDDKVMVATNGMIFLGTEEAGIDAGISKLMEIAKLPGITRTAPVTLRLMFDKSGTQSAAPAATQVAAVTGDVKAGKKVFKKCKACHTVEPGKNKIGPSLHGIIGRPAGKTEGFKYSKAMAGSDVVWTTENLTAFLTKPKKFMKGNKMSFGGLKKAADIENLLAFLASEGS